MINVDVPVGVDVVGDRSFCIQYQWTQEQSYGVSDNFEEEFLCFQTGNDETFSTLEDMLDYMSGRLEFLTA